MSRDAAQRGYGVSPQLYRLPDNTRLGAVRLQIGDLSRSVAYYRDILGLQLLSQSASTARLGVSQATSHLIELVSEPGTLPVPRSGVLGLYHFAILLPSRPALGRFVRHLGRKHVQFGAADHLVSEAIYLWDPDGLGIEVYADRPRDVWQTQGQELVMATERLDLRALVEAASDAGEWPGMPPGTTLGHMHFSVGDLVEASRFFHNGLGFDRVVWSYPGALFMSTGGYHHHVGTNTWALGARPATATDARLLDWELLLPTREDVYAAEQSLHASGYDAEGGLTTDPWGTNLRLTVASSLLSPAA